MNPDLDCPDLRPTFLDAEGSLSCVDDNRSCIESDGVTSCTADLLSLCADGEHLSYDQVYSALICVNPYDGYYTKQEYLNNGTAGFVLGLTIGIALAIAISLYKNRRRKHAKSN